MSRWRFEMHVWESKRQTALVHRSLWDGLAVAPPGRYLFNFGESYFISECRHLFLITHWMHPIPAFCKEWYDIPMFIWLSAVSTMLAPITEDLTLWKTWVQISKIWVFTEAMFPLTSARAMPGCEHLAHSPACCFWRDFAYKTQMDLVIGILQNSAIFSHLNLSREPNWECHLGQKTLDSSPVYRVWIFVQKWLPDHCAQNRKSLIVQSHNEICTTLNENNTETLADLENL